MVTMAVSTDVQHDLDALAEEYASATLGSMEHVSDQDLHDGMAGAFLSFLRDALTVASG